MVHSADSKRLSEDQVLLLEHALRQLTRIDPAGWDEMPLQLHLSFAKYMDADAWTRVPDLLTLREAALMILRDAIARTGEFGEDTRVSMGTGGHM